MPLLNIINFGRQTASTRIKQWLETEHGLTDVPASQFKFETPPDERMGHLAFACFPLAALLKKAPPRIAAELSQRWGNTDCFQKVEAVGPYLNFHFRPDYLAEQLLPHCIQNDLYGDSDQGVGQTLMLEYSSPNTNKPLHLGHGRNNLLGVVLARLLKCVGYRVITANLVNDRGVHICKSMLAYQKWGQGETPEQSGQKGDKLVGNYYVLYDRKEKENPALAEEVQQLLRLWEAKDAETLKLGKRLNGWVLEGFRQTYERMEVSFDKYYFESETYAGGRDIVLKALEKGLCDREPNGAVSIDLSAEGLGRKILLRGDGTSMYITQDIHTTVVKFKDFELNGCLFVVGSEQENHFRMLFTILKRLGFVWADRCEHISYGMITLPEGRMKSREGTVVDLDDLMDEMKTLAYEEAVARKKEGAADENAELTSIAEAIGQAAIKYFILRTNAAKEITFNPKESLSFDGATGPYLQYTHARICSLLKKAGLPETDMTTNGYDWNEEETRLLVQLGRFPDVISLAANDRNPAVLCTFVYDICRLFNKFYYEFPILKAEAIEVVKARVCLTRAVKGVLFKTLRLLGIQPLEKM